MKLIIKLFLLILITAILINCGKNTISSRPYPRLNTLNVTSITEQGVIFNAEIFDKEDFEIISYGFVWSESENPTIENYESKIYSENFDSKNFSSVITTRLKAGKKYFVRSFLKTNDFTVYGDNVSFLSLGNNGPNLIDFMPIEANLNEPIMIIGQNFGNNITYQI